MNSFSKDEKYFYKKRIIFKFEINLIKMQVRIFLKSFSAEKFIENDQFISTQFNISTNVNVTNIQKIEDGIKFSFITDITYSPSIAHINIKGEGILKDDEKIFEIVEKYDKKEALPPYLIQTIVNFSIIEATVLTRSLNIPPPIPLPKISIEEKKKEKDNKLTYLK
ncbi:MAG: hypothetical protein QXP60_08505 [Nitrososphaerota archaeon]